jgi:hypothetical protein
VWTASASILFRGLEKFPPKVPSLGNFHREIFQGLEIHSTLFSNLWKIHRHTTRPMPRPPAASGINRADRAGGG